MTVSLSECKAKKKKRTFNSGHRCKCFGTLPRIRTRSHNFAEASTTTGWSSTTSIKSPMWASGSFSPGPTPSWTGPKPAVKSKLRVPFWKPPKLNKEAGNQRSLQKARRYGGAIVPWAACRFGKSPLPVKSAQVSQDGRTRWSCFDSRPSRGENLEAEVAPPADMQNETRGAQRTTATGLPSSQAVTVIPRWLITDCWWSVTRI